MRWERGRRSENVEDRRGARVGMPGGGTRIGLGGLVILLIAGYFLGIDPLTLLSGVQGGPVGTEVGYPTEVRDSRASQAPPQDELGDFVAVVLGDTEDTWTELFAASGSRYQPPQLVLFSDAIRSACGLGQAAMGPFYCPADQKVYIDLGFYRDLRERFRAPGDFAQAYVIAHEVGHHVQNLLGVSDQVQQRRQQASESEGNALSVRLELQADCLAGVWAHHANRSRQLLEEGDVEEGLRAAAAIGDDRIQRQAQGTIVPESFTHGSSEQRVRWFRRGLDSGDLQTCDTFRAARL